MHLHCFILNFARTLCIHVLRQAHAVAAMNSTSVVDSDTTGCFLELCCTALKRILRTILMCSCGYPNYPHNHCLNMQTSSLFLLSCRRFLARFFFYVPKDFFIVCRCSTVGTFMKRAIMLTSYARSIVGSTFMPLSSLSMHQWTIGFFTEL